MFLFMWYRKEERTVELVKITKLLVPDNEVKHIKNTKLDYILNKAEASDVSDSEQPSSVINLTEACTSSPKHMDVKITRKFEQGTFVKSCLSTKSLQYWFLFQLQSFICWVVLSVRVNFFGRNINVVTTVCN